MNKVSKETIIRTIILAIALLNQILAVCGREAFPITENTVYQFSDIAYQFVSLAFTICASIIAWWKNNSFTQEAIEADKLMHKLKNEDK